MSAPIPAENALQLLTVRANRIFEDASEDRARLTEALAVDGGAHLDYRMEAVLKAEGEAAPWRELMERIERHGVREGLAKQRAKVTTALLEYGVNMSTSLVTNAARLAEHEGLRRFLSATNGMEIADETPAEEPTAAAEPQPAPVEVPRVTEAQRRTLEAIRDCLIQIHEPKVGKVQVSSNNFSIRPRKDMVEYVIEQGWADRDTTTSLFHGQRVTLTALGTAILAA